MNTSTSAFGVQKSMKGLATVEELAVPEVVRVGCKISLNSLKKYSCRQRAPTIEQEKLVSCHKGTFIGEAPQLKLLWYNS